ncbi:ATP-binding protein [Phormidium sp. FACHB-592]|nr:ATP-binding protein [Phormidium sp. FACHB-592]
MSDWARLNEHYLLAAIAQVASYLQAPSTSVTLPETIQPPAAIDQLCQMFRLSSFERAIVLLCAGMELQSDFARLLASSSDDPQRANPTFSLALTHFPQGHWSALTPESPLRRWHLIELGTASTLTHSPLRLNERILHFLLGDTQLEPQLIGLVTALPTAATPILPQSQQQLVVEVLALLQSAQAPSLIQLCGYDSATKRAIATAVCAKLGCGLLNLSADSLPTDLNQLHLMQTLLEREALLTNSLLLLDCDGMQEVEGNHAAHSQSRAIARLMETCHKSMFVFSRDRRSARQRTVFSFEVTQPTTTEQRQIWLQSLEAALEQEKDVRNGSEPSQIIPQIDKLVSHFSLSPPVIQMVCDQCVPQLASVSLESPLSLRSKLQPSPAVHSLPERLWKACLSYARPQMEELAQPIRIQVDWDDLVLPDKEKQILQTVATQVRQRAKVYEQWGFANKGQRGLGISALFAGGSGTGKTLAAEVLANELHLDLYRVDLSSVVSKYIGETEKNLRRIFDAAEMGGAILLFDEADALFGKRSEVKDSHDRYANMEVAYLLQRMEAYRGLAILTTNLKNSLDQAFLRRLRFVVHFTFPEMAQRIEIWQRVFPKSTPIQNLSYQKLARLNVSGGNIRNIALNAAFLAAETNMPIQMQHLLQAAQSEYIKLERPLTEAEIKGWRE